MTQPHPSSLHKDYQLLEEIGRGRFGVVCKCKPRATTTTAGENDIFFAVKSVDKSLVTGDPIDSQSLINEPKALSLLSLSSPHITRLHRAYDTPTHLHLVLDFFPFPSLYDVVSHRHRIPESELHPIASNLLQAILHCHKNGVVHRDIKPENILIDPQTNRLKLCDFGSAGFMTSEDGKMTEVVGTPYYVAPEVLEGFGYGEKVDVWSAGVVMYLMIGGFLPFCGDDVGEVFEKVLRGNLRFPGRVFGSVSQGVKDLLRRMVCKDVSRRFSAEEALRHPWLATAGQAQQ